MDSKQLIKPKHLKRGDTVGIIAPSSPPFEAGALEYTFAWLNKLGLKYKLGKHVFESYSDMAGLDACRLEDLLSMWQDREVSCILPIRGGNGCARLLPHVDFELIARYPKIIIGYSDLTALINPIQQETGLVTFYGPMAGSFYDSKYSHEYFVKALLSTRALGVIHDPSPKEEWNPQYPPTRLVIAEGKGRGRLAGGCLTLIRQLMGTPYEIDTEGKILFLEDVREEPHSIDRYLTQLLLAGKLQKAAGIVLSEFIACKPGDSKRNVLELNYSLESVLRERFSHLHIPVVYGLRFGHGLEQLTLPVGVMASLEASKNKVVFKIEESATS